MKRQNNLPDFIIAGAMKCASNTLHRALRVHDGIFMPARGMVFFAIDDQEEHPDFFVHSSSNWYPKDFEIKFDQYLSWYKSFYSDAAPGQLLGEAAPTYLASHKVPRRLADLIPNVKLIFIFRDPVNRAYSQYWHEVHNGRAFYSFEECISFSPGSILRRSRYLRQLRHFMDYVPKENMKFIVFERFVSEFDNTIRDVLDFLGIDQSLDLKKVSKEKNVTNIHRFHRFQLVRNRVLKNRVPWRYYSFLPDMPPVPEVPGYQKILLKLYNKINPITGDKAPSMEPDTRRFLSEYYTRENEGLSELIGIQLEKYWPSLRSNATE